MAGGKKGDGTARGATPVKPIACFHATATEGGDVTTSFIEGAMDQTLDAPRPIGFDHGVVLQNAIDLAVGGLCVADLLAHLLEEKVDLNGIDLPCPGLQRLT